jgi:hypothetical protein
MKQLFGSLTTRLAESYANGSLQKRDTGSWALMQRQGLLLVGESARDYLGVLEELAEVAKADESWSKDALDDVLGARIAAIAAVGFSHEAMREQTKQFTLDLAKNPTSFEVVIAIPCVLPDAAPLGFGRVQLRQEVFTSSSDHGTLADDHTDAVLLRSTLPGCYLPKARVRRETEWIFGEHR